MSFLTLHIYYIKIFIKNQKRYFLRRFQNFSKRKQKSGSPLHDLPFWGKLIVKQAAASLYFQSLNKSFIAASSAAFILCSIILKIIASSWDFRCFCFFLRSWFI